MILRLFLAVGLLMSASSWATTPEEEEEAGMHSVKWLRECLPLVLSLKTNPKDGMLRSQVEKASAATIFIQGYFSGLCDGYSQNEEMNPLSEIPERSRKVSVLCSQLLQFLEERGDDIPSFISCSHVLNAWYVMNHDKASEFQKVDAEWSLALICKLSKQERSIDEWSAWEESTFNRWTELQFKNKKEVPNATDAAIKTPEPPQRQQGAGDHKNDNALPRVFAPALPK